MMRRLTPLNRYVPWLASWLVVSCVGVVLIIQSELTTIREAFETDARIAHRLLSQRAVQHDAVLSTLTLLRSADTQAEPEQRLSSVYPQIISIQRRSRDAHWPTSALQAAEAVSRRLKRAALAEADFSKGRYSVVMGAEPTSYAVLIDIHSMVPWQEWPTQPATSPVRVALDYGGQTFELQPGGVQFQRASAGVRQFDFHKLLATDSQPFDVVAQRRVGWGELPWVTMLIWTLLMAALLQVVRVGLRQRTDRRRAEELLRFGQVARLNTLGELAAGMAHELNQPLTAMLANAQAANRLLNDDPADLHLAQLAIQGAVGQAQRASDVVNRLRHVVEQPDEQAKIQGVDLHGMTRQALHLLEPEMQRLSIEPAIELAGLPFQVRAEPVALEQIIHNLLMNALQALDQVPAGERRLVLALSTSGKHGQLCVRDTGPGIAVDVIPRIFEPFFTTRRGGLGLGLSLSESLVAGMGGTLVATNRAPRGAEFCLNLPLA
jgi:signal transduction histidine kinase